MATIRKRRNKYWQAIVRCKGTKTQSKTFERKSDAVAWAKLIDSEMQRGTFVDSSPAEGVTVSDLVNRYVSSLDLNNRNDKIAKSCCDMLVK